MAGEAPQRSETADLLVIGGGINGAGIARDAAGRGLSVVLCEQDDLAQHTSSASTKLIHGGLRYLEHYDFRLVHDALQEREVLLRSAPHIIWPLRFLLPHHKELRPRWLIRLGLFLYDRLGGPKTLPPSWSVDLRKHLGGEFLKPEFTRGFEYSDCWVLDARLVVLNARDAQDRGARILTRTKCTELVRKASHWEATLENRARGTLATVRARAVVNATGPWVKRTLNLDRTTAPEHGIRLVKGSHIVVKKLFEHPYAYIFQHADGRVVFAIPFEQDYTLLGTTDVESGDEPEDTQIDAAEIAYICDVISVYTRRPVTASDVIWSYSGVRPLFDDESQHASEVTRDYVLQLNDDGPPIVSVYGGKITTYRKLSEQVIEMLKAPLGVSAAAWTAHSVLPGGDMYDADFSAFRYGCLDRYAWLDESVCRHYARNYGTQIDALLENRKSMDDLGRNFGGGLFECEIEYLIKHEWAETAEDVLWRRTKKGLHIAAGAAAQLEHWLEQNRSHLAA